MKLDVRKLTLALVLTALAAGSWWLAWLATQPAGARPEEKARHDPDYVVENFRSVILTPQGRPQYELQGRRLIHFGDDGSSTVDQPYLIQYRAGLAPTHARAREGYLPKDMSYIRLTGNVNVAQGRDPSGAGGEIRAQTMTLQLDRAK